jgi:hypothetical protein
MTAEQAVQCPRCGSVRWYYWREFLRCIACQHTWQDERPPETLVEYHCEAFDVDGKRIGSFVVKAATMSEALAKAAQNIEVAIRPAQHALHVSRLQKDA